MLNPGLPDGARWYEGMRFEVLVAADATGGQIAVCRVQIPAGTASSVHRHEREDEVVHALAGDLDVWCRGEHRRLAAGDSMLLPRDIPHRLATLPGRGAEALIAFLPGGAESTMLAASTAEVGEAVDPDDHAALLAGAGISLLRWEHPPLPAD